MMIAAVQLHSVVGLLTDSGTERDPTVLLWFAVACREGYSTSNNIVLSVRVERKRSNHFRLTCVHGSDFKDRFPGLIKRFS